MTQATRDVLDRAIPHLSYEDRLDLIEQLARSLRDSTPNSAAAVDQRQALRKLLEEIGALPVKNPADGFSSADHDRILYGRRP